MFFPTYNCYNLQWTIGDNTYYVNVYTYNTCPNALLPSHISRVAVRQPALPQLILKSSTSNIGITRCLHATSSNEWRGKTRLRARTLVLPQHPRVTLDVRHRTREVQQLGTDERHACVNTGHALNNVDAAYILLFAGITSTFKYQAAKSTGDCRNKETCVTAVRNSNVIINARPASQKHALEIKTSNAFHYCPVTNYR